MDEETEKIYEAFGYDCSKPLRKLNQITDEEALTIAKIMDNKQKWTIHSRKDGQIGLKSITPKSMGVLRSFGRGMYNKDIYETIFLNSDGIITGTIYPSVGPVQFVYQYLFSIGVERPVLTKNKLENILNESRK
jgi:hypothetical protein